MHPRRQGDLGEYSAIEWLGSRGYPVWFPLGHSPDCDLITEIGGRLLRVQVKTSTYQYKGRFSVTLATRGGNQSWSGLVKRFSSERCDWLFVLVADGRRWFIPADAVEGGSGLLLGGPKYAAYEVEPGRPLSEAIAA
jgi:Holliday junction resolvase-like predicted endonuclease